MLAIEELSSVQKRRFQFYHLHDLTYDQIGIKEGCSKACVKRSIDRAEEKLREKLLAFGVTFTA